MTALEALLHELAYTSPTASWDFDRTAYAWTLTIHPYGALGGPQRIRFGEPGTRCDYAWPGITDMDAEDALCVALEAVVVLPMRMAA